jgi:peptidoglycan/xylan/chitin deacetylase (PgdA/CDA1 family)
LGFGGDVDSRQPPARFAVRKGHREVRIRTGLKRAAARCLLHTGALSLHRTLLERNRCILLMYHRVNDENDPFFPSLPVRVFSKQLDYLTAHYRIEPLDTAMDWLTSGAPGKPRVVITIDDGYPDTHEFLFPELEKRRLPATLFLSTFPPETSQPLWADRLRNTIKYATKERFELPSIELTGISLRSVSDRLEAIRRILSTLKRKSPAVIEDTLTELRRHLEPDETPRRTIRWEDIRRMAQSGVIEIGAHTHRHYILSHLDEQQAKDEIETSVKLIERKVGTPVSSFSYPNGQPEDYDERSMEVLRSLGVRYAVTTRIDFVRPCLNPYELTRLYTNEPNLSLFAARIAGLHWGSKRQRLEDAAL